MKNLLNKIMFTVLVLALTLLLGACSKNTPTDSTEVDAKNETAESSELKEVQIGVMSTCEPIVEWIGEALEPMGYNVKVVMYDANQLPATATKDGDIDGLIHNHLPWIKTFNNENNSNLVMPDLLAYGRTAMYSSKYTKVDEIPQDATIALAGDPTNLERGLMMLRDVGLISLGDKTDKFYSLLDIVDNPKNIKILETEISTTVRSITDVDAVIAPALRAQLAGIDPNVFLYEDPLSQDFPLGLVVDAENAEEEWLLEAIKYTKTEEFRDKFNTHYDGAYVLLD